MPKYHEPLLTKTKIVATVGPASSSPEQLRNLLTAGVDVLRLNFAHGNYEDKAKIVADARTIAAQLDQPLAILGDLAGPKIRLGELPPEGYVLQLGDRWSFCRDGIALGPRELTSNYSGLIDDLQPGDQIRLADGAVALRVEQVSEDRAVCVVEQSGLIKSRQGVNLPGARLKIASVTEQDEADLAWALNQQLDFIGLSFVRSAADLRHLKSLIEQAQPAVRPWIVAKIEKPEAVQDLDAILIETDVIMVARGDLGVEVDIVEVPVLQKQIIAACNRNRVPVITATQMLESMTENELPTRAEVTDVANAVLDGTDAVMLSGETAVGCNPPVAVTTMSRIARQAVPLLVTRQQLPLGLTNRSTATELTVAITRAAIQTAEAIQARLIILTTRSGKTASAISELRSQVPIIAVTDSSATAALLTLTWGVVPLHRELQQSSPQDVLRFARDWAVQRQLLTTGDRFVFVGSTDWSRSGKDLLLVEAIPASKPGPA
ncbi:MAG: pyruvate kinase [Planctomycetaceae bacterium]